MYLCIFVHIFWIPKNTHNWHALSAFEALPVLPSNLAWPISAAQELAAISPPQKKSDTPTRCIFAIPSGQADTIVETYVAQTEPQKLVCIFFFGKIEFCEYFWILWGPTAFILNPPCKSHCTQIIPFSCKCINLYLFVFLQLSLYLYFYLHDRQAVSHWLCLLSPLCVAASSIVQHSRRHSRLQASLSSSSSSRLADYSAVSFVFAGWHKNIRNINQTGQSNTSRHHRSWVNSYSEMTNMWIVLKFKCTTNVQIWLLL